MTAPVYRVERGGKQQTPRHAADRPQRVDGKRVRRGVADRARAAIALVLAGELKGWEALTMVVYPSSAIEEASKLYGDEAKSDTQEKRRRALRLVAYGMTHRAAAESVGVRRTTVSTWVRDDRERGVQPSVV